MNTVIECKNLTHYYGKRLIYEDLNFSIEKGKVLGLLGKNGTGKTTTINILNGYLEPRSGTCRLFGEDIRQMKPQTRERIALLIEGHQQFAFMNVVEIERFYSSFYPKWNKVVYYELISKLQIDPKQKIQSMSCGQRSQVALGLILAQNADLLILDDFSMGLDPGYRRLFIDYLKDYCSSEEKTVFVTSHIIQDLERFIDDCIILDYGNILVQKPVKELMQDFHKYRLSLSESPDLSEKRYEFIYALEKHKSGWELYSYQSKDKVEQELRNLGLDYGDFSEEEMSLEDIFIGLTGKY
ncbi:uncharacterized ABC transporter ATP-binding protein YhcG-like [Globicephala melas]|uniref:uncharacterized ABC transporter ATP-binding protein YhcG-like n=1 Tax=Globicephala melas TaxID=9731 RepID=UPI00293D8A5E|nr:uncharacterized ABC transporter ATP-binding protein YhcG-like [Globicephala melas]